MILCRAFLLFVAAICSAVSLADPITPSPSVLCERAMGSLVDHLQQGTLGLRDDPFAEFRKEQDSSVFAADNPHGLYALETDIIELFQIDPRMRDTSYFSEKWKLSPEQTLDLLTYYAGQIYEDVEKAGDLQKVYGRLKVVSKEHYLRIQPDNASKRWDFYQASVTKMSVPEMAVVLGISEAQIYSDLSQLQISIIEKFGDKLPQASAEQKLGKSIGEIALQLDVGEQALAYALSHFGSPNRGVGWHRVLSYKGRMELEPAILVDLRGQGLTHQQIADYLNDLAGTTDPTHPERRTESSVGHELTALGLTQPRGTAGSIFLPDYGFVKWAGKLNPVLTEKFLIDHRQMPESWLARELDVTEQGLSAFRDRHHILSTVAGRRQRGNSQSKKLLERYARQVDVIDKYLDWMTANGRRPKDPDDFGLAAGKVGVAGTSWTTAGDEWVFQNHSQKWLAVKLRAQQRGIEFSLTEVKVATMEPEFLKAVREEAVDIYLNYLQARREGKKTPLPFDKAKLLGRQYFAPGARSSEHAYFSSEEEGYLAILARAKARGISFRLLDEQIAIPSPALKAVLRQEAVDEYFDLRQKIKTEPRLSSLTQFKRVSGLDEFSVGGKQEAGAIFRDKEQFHLALKQHALAEKIAFNLFDLDFRDMPGPALRQAWQSEAVGLCADWVEAHAGNFPRQQNFGKGEDEIPFGQQRLNGSGRYQSGGPTYHLRFFDSASEAEAAIRAELARRAAERKF